MTRLYGAYSNRARRLYRPEEAEAPDRGVERELLPKSRANWARLLRMVFEVDPLICPRCSAEMKVVSVITTPADRRLHWSLLPRQSRGGRRRVVIDVILRHLRKTAKDDLWGARAPPAA